MFTHLQESIYPQLKNKGFRNDDELYLFLILQTAIVFVAVIHLFLFVFMLACGILYLPIFNLVSIAVAAVSYFLLTRKRTYLLSGLITTIEVVAYTFLSVYLIGAGNYILLYIILVLVMQILIPYTAGWARGIVSFLLWCSAVIIVTLDAGNMALLEVDGRHQLAISIFNLCVTAIGITTALMIGNAIKRVIAHYNEMRLKELQTQANTDPLTGLFNRRYAEMVFERLQNSGEKGAACIAILDIDDFKHVNDTYGHSVGDEVLCGITDVMRRMLRKTDLIIRWGGEEFLILLSGVDLAMSHFILEKMRNAIGTTTFETQAGPVRITATIGVAAMNVERIPESIEMCDMKLYTGKSGGKNMVSS